jgi:curved DNA-binding protein CbpA
MNGQLRDHPLAELIREISAKEISGRLSLQNEGGKVVVYFKQGSVVYAASNVRTLRLAEYLRKGKLINEKDLANFGDQRSDLDLAQTLCKENLLDPEHARKLQVMQVSDVLRAALLWTEGTWGFDGQSHLREEVSFKPEINELLLEAGRRIPLQFSASRFQNPSEVISPSVAPALMNNLMPTEGFLLSRLDGPMQLSDLVALSGLRELDALRVVYSLAISGLLLRENWKSAFRKQSGKPAPKPEHRPAPSPAIKEQAKPPSATETLDAFLTRIARAASHYDVLAVDQQANPTEIKNAYYQLARHYHPDRFRNNPDGQLHARVESAFARITQAYETLKDERHRSNYDSKLEALAKVKRSSEPVATVPTSSSTDSAPPADATDDSSLSEEERAELNFKEGMAALQLGQVNSALGLFGSAAQAVPGDARYRAYYGHTLAARDNTRRLAETELQAALKLDPNNSDYRVMLAELYRDLGFLKRARSEAERAVSAGPKNLKARDLLRSLK